MTYRGSLCEHADLGFTIEALLTDFHVVRLGVAPAAAPPDPARVPRAVPLAGRSTLRGLW